MVASKFERQYLRDRYGSPYFFSAQVFQEGFDLHMIELQTVYRQTDRSFINLLDNIRTRQFDYDDLEMINSRHTGEESNQDMAITLCSTNAKVNKINTEMLKQITAPVLEYQAKVNGHFNQSNFPADQFLWLKQGAQVMFVKNDLEGRFVNGTIGTVSEISHEKIIVKILDMGEEKSVNVDVEEWEIIKYEIDPENPDRFKTQVTGTYKQYPLKLAWAITIHKSQGKTFDKIIVDLGTGAFDYGQTYVALSRCRTLEGIQLKQKIKPKDILVDESIVEYYEFKKRNW